MDRESERWLSGLRSGDPVLREATWTDLCRYAYRVAILCLRKYGQFSESQVWDVAEDVTQEALIDIMRKLDTFNGRSKFTTWVFSCVRLNALEVLRKHGSHILAQESPNGYEPFVPLEIVADLSVSGPEPDAEAADLLRATQEIINASLTERQRRVLLLNVAGYSAEEIADLLGITTNNAYYLLHAARKRLAHGLRARGYTAREPADVGENSGDTVDHADCPRRNVRDSASSPGQQCLSDSNHAGRSRPKENAPFDTYGYSEEK